MQQSPFIKRGTRCPTDVERVRRTYSGGKRLILYTWTFSQFLDHLIHECKPLGLFVIFIHTASVARAVTGRHVGTAITTVECPFLPHCFHFGVEMKLVKEQQSPSAVRQTIKRSDIQHPNLARLDELKANLSYPGWLKEIQKQKCTGSFLWKPLKSVCFVSRKRNECLEEIALMNVLSSWTRIDGRTLAGNKTFDEQRSIMCGIERTPSDLLNECTRK